MPELLLGPLLRYVGDECAVFWVETDEPCEVEVLGRAPADLPGGGPPLRPDSR